MSDHLNKRIDSSMYASEKDLIRNRSIISTSNYTTAYVKKKATPSGSVNVSISSNHNNYSMRESEKPKGHKKTGSAIIYEKKNSIPSLKGNSNLPNNLISSVELTKLDHSLSANNINYNNYKSVNKSLSINKNFKNNFNTHNNIPKVNIKNQLNSTPKSEKVKKQGSKNKPTSEFERLVDNFSELLTTATRNSVYFLEKEVLNSLSGISTETFQMEKFIKINEFCKEVENLEMEIAKIQNFRAIKKQQSLKANNGNSDEKLSDNEENMNLNVLKIASERRVSVYDYFFESIKENLGDIQYISTELKDIKKNTVKKQTTNILKDVLFNTSNNMESDREFQDGSQLNSHNNSQINFKYNLQYNYQNNLNTSQNNLNTSQNNLNTSQNNLNTSQNNLNTSQNELNRSQNNLNTSQNNQKTSNSQIDSQNNSHIINQKQNLYNGEESEQSEIAKNNSDYHNDSIVYSNIVKSKLGDSDLLNDQQSSSNEVTFIDLEHVEANEEKNEKIRVAETSVKNVSLTKSFKQFKKQDTIKDFLIHLDKEEVHTSLDKTVIYQYCSGDANNSIIMLDNIKRDLFHEAKSEFHNKKANQYY